MSTKPYLGAVLILAITVAGHVVRAHSQDQEARHSEHEWDYTKDHGPAHWGELKPEFATCRSGHHQSPIDIQKTERADLPSIEFKYRASPLRIIDNGHSIQVNYAPGSSIRVGGREFVLKQFHFHHPSEEMVHGRHYEMGVHLVHADAAGRLAVVAVLFDAGAENPMVRQLWNNLREQGHEERRDDVHIDAADLLPSDRGYYTFEGSLTTPPCTENVTWFVLKQPVSLSTAEIAEFAKRYPDDARPAQPLYGRIVKETQ
jgi:carbonic anhydrase